MDRRCQLPCIEETSISSPETSEIRPPGNLEVDSAPAYKRNRSTTATVGLEGGTLKLYGVSLKIPPEALHQEEKITLEIIRNQHHQLSLDDRTALLTPIVRCEPHGLQFTKPVELVLPHCAQTNGSTNIEEAWEFTVLKSETKLNESDRWVETTPDDCSDRKITDRYIHLQIRHFTEWVVTGAIYKVITGVMRALKDYFTSSKKIKLVAYSPTKDKTHNVFKVFVCCLDDYPQNVRVSRPLLQSRCRKFLLQCSAHVVSRPSC